MKETHQDVPRASPNVSIAFQKRHSARESLKERKVEGGTSPINATLLDDPVFGKVYLYVNRSTRIVSRDVDMKDSWTGKFTRATLEAMVITVRLESISKNPNKDKIPKTFQFEECIGMYGEISSILHKCAWFRIKFAKDNPDDGTPSIVRGFDSGGKCIYYNECIFTEEKELEKVISNPSMKNKTSIEIPKMREPL